jgi:transposase-like protein
VISATTAIAIAATSLGATREAIHNEEDHLKRGQQKAKEVWNIDQCVLKIDEAIEGP